MRKSSILRAGPVALAVGFVVASILAATSSGAASRAVRVTATGLTTSLSSATTTVGGAGVHDTATLSGLTGSTFTGDAVSYAVYPSLSACMSGTGGTAEGRAVVSGNGTVGASNTFAPTTPGTYYWQASFNGADKTNAPATSDCSSEALNVTAATTPVAVTTSLSSATTTVGGAGVHDTATVSGLTGSTFTGDMVSYSVYPSLSACTSGSGGTAEGSVAVSGNGTVAASNTFAPTTPGTYYWQASFNGADKTNGATSSSCSSEPLHVFPTHPVVPPGHGVRPGHRRGHLVCFRVFRRGHHHHHGRFELICVRARHRTLGRGTSNSQGQNGRREFAGAGRDGRRR